jgi:hypothetical protein
MTAQYHHDSILPIADTEAIVSLTINVETSGETNVLRLNV